MPKLRKCRNKFESTIWYQHNDNESWNLYAFCF